MDTLFVFCGMSVIVFAVLFAWYWLVEGRHEKQKPLRKYSEEDDRDLEEAFYADYNEGWGDR